MLSGYGGVLQGATLQQGRVDITTGSPAMIGTTVVECIEDGSIQIVWQDQTTTDVFRTSGWVNPVDAFSVRVMTGKWVLSRV